MTDEGKKKAWGRLILLLKYGAGIIIAAISVYGAKQEKGKEALEKLRASYDEQTKQVLVLQQVAKVLEQDQRHLYRQCQKEMDAVRSNMTFFLMGVTKLSSNKELADSVEAKKLLKALLKEAPAQFTQQRSVQMYPPKPFAKIKGE